MRKKNTWVTKLRNNGIDCYYYSGSAQAGVIDDDEILTTVQDDLNNTYDKLIASIDLLRNNGKMYDFIFKTNLSTYVNVDKFISFIEENCFNEDSYEGVLGCTNYCRESLYLTKYAKKISGYLPNIIGKIPFVSGAGSYLGMRTIQKICSIKRKKSFIDDVEIGYRVKRLGLDITQNAIHKRYDLILDSPTSNIEVVRNFTGYQFRLKNNNRKNDVDLMYKLHEILEE